MLANTFSSVNVTNQTFHNETQACSPRMESLNNFSSYVYKSRPEFMQPTWTPISTVFPYCKRRKAGRGLGTRLSRSPFQGCTHSSTHRMRHSACIPIKQEPNIISRSVAHGYHGVFLVFEFDRFFSEVELHPRLSHRVSQGHEGPKPRHTVDRGGLLTPLLASV